ncbi:MAG: DUF3035 domain-containing protein [Rhodobacteraceae bacterium]|nr:DUF3035 domain-containing protein [Paracoccaceae bacterium]
MRISLWSACAMMTLLAVAVGCSRDDSKPDLVQYRSISGPDEFSVTVYPPISKPTQAALLPQPKPGAPARATVSPSDRAILLLGGNPQSARNLGISQRHAPLMTHIAGLGIEPGIRETLASEDLEYRRGKGAKPVERMFSYSVYFRAYQPLSLDPVAESKRLSELGINTTMVPAKATN